MIEFLILTIALGIVLIRLFRDEAKHKKEDQAGTFYYSQILATFFFTNIFVIVFFSHQRPYLEFTASAAEIFAYAVIYAILHPVIGKVIIVIIELLSKAFDSLYNVEMTWPLTDKLSAASRACIWPVYGVIMILILVIGLLYGLIFKRLFK